ncbi:MULTISPECIES: hypothetical protein [unclassified Streptomyces]|uniref:hypothetical protein n=1 Tax=unclassified Streptomyces TaxID=2593676 RepID=UPI002E323558|nr:MULTISPECIES: hypothetical protein [unclassified Streptomyces]
METQMWNALADSMKGAYAAGLAEGAVPRPVIMPLVRGRLVGLIWVRPTKSGEDALTGIAQLSNIAAAAGADEIVLAWESRDVATACELPLSGPAPCLNMVHATRDGHVLHQFPYEERVLARDSEGVASIDPDWLTAPEPQPGGELVPPVRAAVDYSFVPLELDHPNPFGVTVVLMEEDGYKVRLTDT